MITMDLTDLTFTEIPWLLRSYQQDQSLVDMSNSIFSKTHPLQMVLQYPLLSKNLFQKQSLLDCWD